MSYTPERVREYAKRGVTGAAYSTDFAPGISLKDQTGVLDKPATADGLVKPQAPFLPLGAISDDGLTNAFDEEREQFMPWGMTTPWLTALTGKTRTFTLSPWEMHRPIVRSLLYVLALEQVGNDPADETAGTPGGAFKFEERATPVEDIRPWVIDTINGSTWERYGLPNAEVTERGEISGTMGALSTSELTITLYPDADDVLIYHVGQIRLPATTGSGA